MGVHPPISLVTFLLLVVLQHTARAFTSVGIRKMRIIPDKIRPERLLRLLGHKSPDVSENGLPAHWACVEGRGTLLAEAKMAAREQCESDGSVVTLETHLSGFQPPVLRSKGSQPLQLMSSFPRFVLG